MKKRLYIKNYNVKNYYIEIKKDIWKQLRTYLQQNNIYYEVSEIKGNLLVIEFKATEEQIIDINLYLDFLYTE